MADERTIETDEQRDVISGLVKFFNQRERQITELMNELEVLKSRLDRVPFTNREKNAARMNVPDIDCRILIVCDSEYMINNLKRLFSSRGYEVVGETADQSEAIRICDETRPDVVTVEFKSDSGEISELLMQLREIDSAMHMILITNNKSDDDLIRAIQAGATDVLAKPVKPDRLVSLIDTLVNRGSKVLT